MTSDDGLGTVTTVAIAAAAGTCGFRSLLPVPANATSNKVPRRKRKLHGVLYSTLHGDRPGQCRFIRGCVALQENLRSIYEGDDRSRVIEQASLARVTIVKETWLCSLRQHLSCSLGILPHRYTVLSCHDYPIAFNLYACYGEGIEKHRLKCHIPGIDYQTQSSIAKLKLPYSSIGKNEYPVQESETWQ